MSFFKNAAPQDINLGAVDKSIKPTPIKPIIIPTHLPLCFGFTAGGPATKEIVDGGRLLNLYKSESFDRGLPYFSHTTRLAEIVTGAGNAIAMVRIIPDDNDTIANVTVYADMLADTVSVWKRNADGSFALDSDGNKIKDVDVSGYRVKIISEVNDDDILTPYGAKTSKPGYMTDSDSNQSTMIPLFELRAKYKGKLYNNYGITINTPSEDNLNENILKGTLAMPYELGLVKRADVNSTGKFINNLFGVPFTQFSFKENGKDSLTHRPVDVLDAIGSYSNTDNPLRDIVFPDFEKPYVYRDNLKTALDNLFVAEKDYVNANVTLSDDSTRNTSEWMDYLSTVPVEDQAAITNILTAKSSKNVPAFTFYIDDTAVTLADNQKEVHFSKYSPIYLGNGKDGTLSIDNLEAGVSMWMDKYLDKNSDVMDPAIDLENVLYDSGFRLPIKEKLVSFIAVRKNTYLALGTHIIDGNKPMTLTDERAVGVTLKAALGLAPESTFANTSVARGIIVVGSGLDSRDPSNNRYPLSMDIAYKAAKMMGGVKWNKNLIFDSGGKNLITNYSDVYPKRVPKGIIADLWNIGLIWPENYDTETKFFPAMHSVYDNDTSVLSNFYAGIALTVDNNIASAVWRKYTGTVTMTPSEFTAAVEKEMNAKLNGVFDGVINASAKAMITDFDEQNGFSYTVASILGGNVMKTVQTHYAEVWNNADL